MKIYVGTYAKYNNGDLKGEWLDLEDYADLDEFYAACKELHSDEEDPEYMFQDWEGIPDLYIGESWLDETIFKVIEFIEKSHMDEEAILAGLGLDIPIEKIEEAYQGQYDSDEDFARQFADDIGAIQDDCSWPYTCIDWEWAARELMYDYQENNGYYFSCNW